MRVRFGVMRVVFGVQIAVVALRIFGKKELSQLNPADIVLILLISNAVQNAMVGSDITLEGGLIAAFSLFSINFIFKKVVLVY